MLYALFLCEFVIKFLQDLHQQLLVLHLHLVVLLLFFINLIALSSAAATNAVHLEVALVNNRVQPGEHVLGGTGCSREAGVLAEVLQLVKEGLGRFLCLGRGGHLLHLRHAWGRRQLLRGLGIRLEILAVGGGGGLDGGHVERVGLCWLRVLRRREFYLELVDLLLELFSVFLPANCSLLDLLLEVLSLGFEFMEFLQALDFLLFEDSNGLLQRLRVSLQQIHFLLQHHVLLHCFD